MERFARLYDRSSYRGNPLLDHKVGDDMNAQERLAGITQEVTNLLSSDEVKKSKIPLGEWEERYKKLKAIRAFFGVPWNEIEVLIKSSEFPEEWIWESRKDVTFKKYYALRHKADALEVLVK